VRRELSRGIRPRSCIAAFAFVFLVATAGESGRAEEFRGKVVGVSDGDTITVLREPESARVRLNGIDAPESGQPFGTRAKEFASDIAFGKVVTIKGRTLDRFGRIVADMILLDGEPQRRDRACRVRLEVPALRTQRHDARRA
jgi:endonuclease YncB( thermonuclease family)